MTGERDLPTLLGSMHPVIHDDIYVFVTATSTVGAETFEPRLLFVEEEGVTFILTETEAKNYGLDYKFPCRMITLNVYSSLDAVGLIAAVTAHLAKESISVNTVSAFFHDHLFVPTDRADDAMSALRELSERFR